MLIAPEYLEIFVVQFLCEHSPNLFTENTHGYVCAKPLLILFSQYKTKIINPDNETAQSHANCLRNMFLLNHCVQIYKN